MFVQNFSKIKVTFDSKEDSLKTGCIYLLLFPNQKIYIGQTTRVVSKRMAEHCYGTSECIKSSKYKY